LLHENSKLRKEAGKIQEYKRKMEERKVVYGPRPTGYKEDINK